MVISKLLSIPFPYHMANLQASLTTTRIRMLCCWAKHFAFPVSLSICAYKWVLENCQNISGGSGAWEVGSGKCLSERGLVMKPDEFFVNICCMFLFAFSAVAQFIQISLPRDWDIRYRNSMSEVPSSFRRRPYRLSRNLFPNERLHDECSPKVD